jgi:hypothetical protein
VRAQARARSASEDVLHERRADLVERIPRRRVDVLEITESHRDIQARTRLDEGVFGLSIAIESVQEAAFSVTSAIGSL